MKGRAKTVREMLRLRGIAVSEAFPANVPGFAEASEEAAAAATLACDSEEDFRARIAAAEGSIPVHGRAAGRQTSVIHRPLPRPPPVDDEPFRRVPRGAGITFRRTAGGGRRRP